MIIYFDLDGVLCDFEGKILELYGIPFESGMWSDIAANHEHIYTDLKPFENMVGLVKRLVDSGKDVRILSAQPSMVKMPYAVADKVEWCRKYLPPIELIVVDKAYDKQFLSDYDSVLIDDSNINIEQWVARGGLGIHHRSFRRTELRLEKF